MQESISLMPALGSHEDQSRWRGESEEAPTRWMQMLRERVSAEHVLLHPDFLRETEIEMKRNGQPAYIAREYVIDGSRACSQVDERFARKPGLVVRMLAWLVRPIIWEAMRQHPTVDGNNRCTGEPMIRFWDAVWGRNRHLGVGS